MGAHPAKAGLSKEKSPGDFLVLESDWGVGCVCVCGGSIFPKLAGKLGSVIHMVVALESLAMQE